MHITISTRNFSEAELTALKMYAELHRVSIEAAANALLKDVLRKLAYGQFAADIY